VSELRTADAREHRHIKAKHQRQPYYFRRWYCCAQENCATTLVMLQKFKVVPRAAPERVKPFLQSTKEKCPTSVPARD
jgi:hypothetical protein